MDDKNNEPIPVISVGMPVFNGEKTLKAALDCVLSQTFGDFELIVSDNCSTDKTEEICKEYAARDPRVRYIRQPVNMGAVKNFQFVLQEARAKYFMWATSDDVKSADFLEINYYFLKDNPEYVASTCRSRFVDTDFDERTMGDASLEVDLPERFLRYFNCWHANGRFCSLMRMDALMQSPYIKEEFFGSDWAAMLSVIIHGKTRRHDKGYVVIGREGFSNSGNIFKHYRKRLIHWVVPFTELFSAVRDMTSDFPWPYQARILWALIKLNRKAMRAALSIEIKNFNAR